MERITTDQKLIALAIIGLLFGVIIGYTIKYNELVDKYISCENENSNYPIESKKDVYYPLEIDGQINFTKSYTYEDLKEEISNE